MKRFVVLFLVLVLFIPVAFASGIIDFSVYTDEELETIVAELNKELVARGVGKSAVLTPGDYVIGRDIPAGRYIVTATTTEEHPYVIIYTDEKMEDYTYANNFYSVDEVSIMVEEGQILQIRYQKVHLTISAGIVFQ